jgi:lipoyl(octanoyl) transferase
LNKHKKIIVKNLGLLDFEKTFHIQKDLQNQIIETKLNNRKNNLNSITPNFLLFVEHDHVYTLGNSGNENNLIFDKKRLEEMGIKYHKTNRGGDITYHGPGQLVCYPILDLENFYRDIHKYLRDLEDVVINTLDYFNISASGNSKDTGVWLDVGTPEERKICAMGIKVSRWVTMHGLALNVNTNLSYFNGIIPCGISGKGVTSISNELNKTIKLDLVRKVLTENFLKKFS